VELSKEQNIFLVQEYVKKQFVDNGMCADIAIHDTGGGNPHAHILLTMRPIEQSGEWGAKSKKEYILDDNGDKIILNSGEFKSRKIDATDWNDQSKAEIWRGAWADICNQYLEKDNHAERIDHRSYERQGIDQIPTIHLGVAASQMEKRGIRTERGNINRDIEVSNQRLRQLKARIIKLQDWLDDEMKKDEKPSLADYIQDILYRQAQDGKSQRTQSIYNLKDAANMLNFLTRHDIMDIAKLDKVFGDMFGKQQDIRDALKPIDRRLKTLDKHIEQADIYLKYKGKKTLTKAEQTLFTAAKDYLKGVMNGKTTLPTEAWKAERMKLIAERKSLDYDYYKLKDEIKEAEQIRKSVYSIVRQEERERQLRRGQDIDR